MMPSYFEAESAGFEKKIAYSKNIVDQCKTRHTCNHIFSFDFRIMWVQFKGSSGGH